MISKSASWSWLLLNDPDGLLSQAGACVLVPAGVEVEYDVCNASGPVLKCLVVLGVLRFSSVKNSCLRVGTLQLHDAARLIIDHSHNSGDSDSSSNTDGGTVSTVIEFSHAAAVSEVEDPGVQIVGLQAYHADIIMKGQARCGLKLHGQDMRAGTTTIKVNWWQDTHDCCLKLLAAGIPIA